MEVETRQGRNPLYLTRIASFVSVGLVVGLALSGVPNVELVTAVCFASGFLLGPAAGLITGGLTEALFAGFNPLGSSMGLLLVAQVIGMSLAGLMGALVSRLCNRTVGFRYVATVVGFGFLTTVLFDILTNLAFPVMAGFSFSQYVVTMVAAVPFAAIHLVSNTLVFLFVVAPLLPRLRKALVSA
jgi:uncharacterized membrane protein